MNNISKVDQMIEQVLNGIDPKNIVLKYQESVEFDLEDYGIYESMSNARTSQAKKVQNGDMDEDEFKSVLNKIKLSNPDAYEYFDLSMQDINFHSDSENRAWFNKIKSKFPNKNLMDIFTPGKINNYLSLLINSHEHGGKYDINE